jgi:hypothetical protein
MDICLTPLGRRLQVGPAGGCRGDCREERGITMVGLILRIAKKSAQRIRSHNSLLVHVIENALRRRAIATSSKQHFQGQSPCRPIDRRNPSGMHNFCRGPNCRPTGCGPDSLRAATLTLLTWKAGKTTLLTLLLARRKTGRFAADMVARARARETQSIEALRFLRPQMLLAMIEYIHNNPSAAGRLETVECRRVQGPCSRPGSLSGSLGVLGSVTGRAAVSRKPEARERKGSFR